MAKLKLTKGELKRQRDSLAQFQHFLPTLQLKKQQLQIKIFEVRRIFDENKEKHAALEERLASWIGLLADPRLGANREAADTPTSAVDTGTAVGPFDIGRWIVPRAVTIETMNIAGANVPVLTDVTYHAIDYDFFSTPLWVDRAVTELQAYMSVLIERYILQRQLHILEQELRITTQRVNLFEKIKIPACLENIRKIRIYLGDVQANAVGISKVAKKKLEVQASLASFALNGV